MAKLNHVFRFAEKAGGKLNQRRRLNDEQSIITKP